MTDEIELYKKVGLRLKTARERAGLSQEDVRKYLEYKSSSSISQHEKGEKLPRPEECRKLSVLYGVSMDYLYTLADHPNISGPETRRLDPDEAELLSLYREATDQQKNLARQLLLLSVDPTPKS